MDQQGGLSPEESEAEQEAREEAAERTREIHLTMDLCLRIGEMLLSSGAGAADVTATMRAVADHLGLRQAEVDVTFTALSMSYQRSADDVPMLMLRHVQQRDIDYEDLTAVDHLVRDILADEADLFLARSRMATIVSLGHAFPRWAVTLAWAVMAAAVGVFLGGGVVVSAVAALAAVLIDRVQILMARRRLPFFYLQVAGGAIATILAAAVAATPIDVDESLVVTANIILLLAGIGLMGAVQDALTGFYLTASARLIEAMMATAGIIAGVALGISVADGAGIPLGPLVPGRLGDTDLPVVLAGAAVSSAAFSVACYAPRRAVLPIGLITAVAALIAQTVEVNGFGRAAAAGVGGVLRRPGRLRRGRPGAGAAPRRRGAGDRALPAGPLDLPRPHLPGRRRLLRLAGHPRADDRDLGRDRAGVRRDPRGVRRPAAQAGGPQAGEPARRSPPGRPLPGDDARRAAGAQEAIRRLSSSSQRRCVPSYGGRPARTAASTSSQLACAASMTSAG